VRRADNLGPSTALKSVGVNRPLKVYLHLYISEEYIIIISFKNVI